jgi:hypothetical protein
LQPPNMQISSRKYVCPTTKYDLSWFHQPKTMDVACLLPKLSPQNDQNGWVDTSTPTKTCLLLILLGYVIPRTRPMPPPDLVSNPKNVPKSGGIIPCLETKYVKPPTRYPWVCGA